MIELMAFFFMTVKNRAAIVRKAAIGIIQQYLD